MRALKPLLLAMDLMLTREWSTVVRGLADSGPTRLVPQAHPQPPDLHKSANDRSSKEEFSCWYTNATALNNKMGEFQAIIEHDKPQVIFITETWFNESTVPTLPICSLYRRDRENLRGGGVCIYVHKSIISNETSFDSLLDLDEQIWCEIRLSNEHILPGCIYRPHMNDPTDKIASQWQSHLYHQNSPAYWFAVISISLAYHGAQKRSDTNDTNEDSPANSFVDTLANSYLTQFVSTSAQRF